MIALIAALTISMRDVAYALDLYDDVNTATRIRMGYHEVSFWNKPFSHGGLPMELAGSVATDYALDRLTQRWDSDDQNARFTFEAGASLDGIARTNGWHLGIGVRL